MCLTVVWLGHFVEPLAVEPVFIPNAWTGFLEPIPMDGYIAHLRYREEGRCPASSDVWHPTCVSFGWAVE